ncbi:MAG: mechanosensitive ion channel family protein [Acidimicrobiia bacterium]
MLQAVDSTTAGICGGASDYVCNWVFDWSGNEPLAKAVGWVVDRPLRVFLILLVAYLVNRLVWRAIERAVARMIAEREQRLAAWLAAHDIEPGGQPTELLQYRSRSLAMAQATEQSKQRAQTLGSVMRSTTTAIIYTLALLMALAQIEVNLGPLIASAGIAGIALGFGAQSIVKDFLSGFFMLVEDQYGVGDIIDVGEAAGVVEAISLRTTKIRDVNGTLWFVPHGEIARVANKSQQWSRAVLDIEVAYDTDIDNARRVIKEVADQVWSEHIATATIIEEPEIWGVERFGESAIAIRLVVKTEPGEQWTTAREIRGRLIKAFTAEGIEIPFPQRVIWTRSDTTE